MSLKQFHLFFIGIAMMITAGFGYWAFSDFKLTQSLLTLMLSVLSFASTIGLTVYLFWFIRKAKSLPA